MFGGCAFFTMTESHFNWLFGLWIAAQQRWQQAIKERNQSAMQYNYDTIQTLEERLLNEITLPL